MDAEEWRRLEADVARRLQALLEAQLFALFTQPASTGLVVERYEERGVLFYCPKS